MSSINPDEMNSVQKVQYLMSRSTIEDDDFIQCLQQGNLLGLRERAQHLIAMQNLSTRDNIWAHIAIDAVNRYQVGDLLNEEDRVERFKNQISSSERLDMRDLRE